MTDTRKITTADDARNALAEYAGWYAALLAAAKRRHAGFLELAGLDGWWAEEHLAGELPPRPPRLAPQEPVDADAPPVAYFGDRRIASVRPVQASERPRWTVRDPLPVGANGVRIKRPAAALAAVVSDLDQLAAVVGACTALASTCRAAGMTDRGALWQAEADQLAAFATRHAQDTVPTLGTAWLAEWRALEVTYPAPEPPPTPVRRPVTAARLR